MWSTPVTSLVNWMASTTGDLALCNMADAYLSRKGDIPMVDCVTSRQPLYRILAEHHDCLGWDNFVKRRICNTYLQVVHDCFNSPYSCLRPESWGKKLVSLLIQMTHKQWLFRNAHVHYKKLEGLTAADHERIYDCVLELRLTDPAELLGQHQ